MTRIIILAMLLTGCATTEEVARTGPWTDFFNEPQNASIPGDVRKFVINAQGCGHFSGEEGYDAERTAYLKKAMDEMCPGISANKIKLLARYPDNAAVQAIITEVTDGYSFD